MVLKKVEAFNLFKWVAMKDGLVLISHLQFSNDTLIFCGPSMEQIRNVKQMLRCFQVSSRLSINFIKSCLYRVGVEQDLDVSVATAIRCKTGALPTSYLGLPLRARANSLAIWKSIFEKIEKKLETWKANSLTFEDRLLMVRSIISSFFYVHYVFLSDAGNDKKSH